MAKATIASIRTLSDKLHNRWTRDFAGKPRHTRDLAELEKLIEKAAGLAKKAKGIPGEKGDEVEKVVVERWKLYLAERDAIAETQYERPEVADIHRLGQRVDRVVALWRRHYAGRDRRTRDVPRLDDMIATLATALPQLEALADHPEVKKDALEGLRGQLEVYKDERAEIDKLRRGMEGGNRLLWVIAEAQSALDQYRVHFAQQPRAITSPARLERLIPALVRAIAELEERMTDPDISPEVLAAHHKNREVLGQHLAGWRAELPLLHKAKAETEPRLLTNQLGAAANQLFQIYAREFAGKDRATRNLQLLSDICDRLTDVAELMTEHDAATREPINRKNVPLVDERLRRYEQEWNEIAKVKAQAAAAQASAQAQAPAAGAGVKKAAAPTKPSVQLPGITIADKKPASGS